MKPRAVNDWRAGHRARTDILNESCNKWILQSSHFLVGADAHSKDGRRDLPPTALRRSRRVRDSGAAILAPVMSFGAPSLCRLPEQQVSSPTHTSTRPITSRTRLSVTKRCCVHDDRKTRQIRLQKKSRLLKKKSAFMSSAGKTNVYSAESSLTHWAFKTSDFNLSVSSTSGHRSAALILSDLTALGSRTLAVWLLMYRQTANNSKCLLIIH